MMRGEGKESERGGEGRMRTKREERLREEWDWSGS